MSQHSPGPFEIHENVIETGDIHIAAAGYDKEEHGYPVIIANVVPPEEYGYDSPFDRETAMANARLFKAAPKLLAALRHFADQHTEDAHCHRGICKASECGRCSKILAARDAIAEAE